MNTYETRITAVVVAPKGHPIFSECATTVRIDDDDAGGEFVEVEQSGRVDLGKICISPEEWPALRAAIDDLISKCRDNGSPESEVTP